MTQIGIAGEPGFDVRILHPLRFFKLGDTGGIIITLVSAPTTPRSILSVRWHTSTFHADTSNIDPKALAGLETGAGGKVAATCFGPTARLLPQQATTMKQC